VTYYREIGGKRYDRALLEIAEEKGAITTPRARRIVGAIIDAGRFTPTERSTLRLIVDRFSPMSDAAERVLQAFLTCWPGERSTSAKKMTAPRKPSTSAPKKKPATTSAPKKRATKKKRAKKTKKRAEPAQAELF